MNTLLEVSHVSVEFGVGRSRWGKRRGSLRALDDVSLTVEPGEFIGIVGESGSGKTTLARAIAGLVPLEQGAIALGGSTLGSERSAGDRRLIQMVFQDPASSLNPRRTVGSVLRELVRFHDVVPPSEVDEYCVELIESVGLAASMLDVTPGRLSGGQRQRVGIARALSIRPRLLICDESVSSLDVSLQASILLLLAELRVRLGLTIVFIAHDLAMVRAVCDRVAVMYLGRVVEVGPTEQLFAAPGHPYTEALLRAAPRLGRALSPTDEALPGESPSAINRPTGCSFRTRCRYVHDRCEVETPQFSGSQGVACHLGSVTHVGRPQHRNGDLVDSSPVDRPSDRTPKLAPFPEGPST